MHKALIIILLSVGVSAGDLVTDFSNSRDWKSGPEAPRAHFSRAQDGVTFPCPFNRASARFYWDMQRSMNLSDYDTLAVDFYCDRPDAFKSIGIYFKSGRGWYAYNIRNIRRGHNTLTISLEDFLKEDEPSGFHSIQAVRISPWKAKAVKTSLTFGKISAYKSRVLVLKNERVDSYLAKRLNANMGRWLDRSGIQYAVKSDNSLRDGALGQYAVIILPYNPDLPENTRQSLINYCKGGGKLIVCYGQDGELARAMGLKMGAYAKADPLDQWRKISVSDKKMAGLPNTIYQDSGNVLPALPATADSEIIAYWYKNGSHDRQPAITWSPSGFWISHILKRNDSQAKQSLLAAMIAHCDGELAQEIARHAVNHCGRVGPYTGSLNDTAFRIQRTTEKNKGLVNASRSLEHIRRAQELYTKAVQTFSRKQYLQTLSNSYAAREELATGYALTAAPKMKLRGVWEHKGYGLYPGDWNKTADILEQGKINTLFVDMLSAGEAHYPSRVIPPSNIATELGDQIAQCIRACNKRNIAVHIWKVCWKVDDSTPAFRAEMEKQGRLQMDVDGKIQPWLNPADPRNQRHEIESIMEIVSHYRVDGIHLDYIRYPNGSSCYSPATRRFFEQWLGKTVTRWPKDVLEGGYHYGSYRKWRAEVINGYIKKVRTELRKKAPGVKLSAAVFGGYPECIESVGQDWGTWLKKGWVDFVCPMNYTEDSFEFNELIRHQQTIDNRPGAIIPGIGVSAGESSLSIDRITHQINQLKARNFDGYVLFDLDPELAERVWSIDYNR